VDEVEDGITFGSLGTIMALQGVSSLLFQVPFRAVFGQESTLATIAATLAIAALRKVAL